MQAPPKIAIVYLLWSNEPDKYLIPALEGISKQTYPQENIELLVIYNFHRPEEASRAPQIRAEISRRAGFLPPTTILIQDKNLGFAGGNNLGMRWAAEHGFEYVLLHNADGFLAPDAVQLLIAAMEKDKSIGQAQPLILLYPERQLINSAGNAWHYLGMGYCEKERASLAAETLPPIKEIGYASGAATILRTNLLRQFGVWRDLFFLYHEDTEYSLRLRTLGYKIVLVSGAIFYHQYEFKRSAAKFFWIERNRHAIKLLFYKWPTLLLLAPLEAAYNAGLIFTALRGGWVRELLKVYGYWASPGNWKPWLKLRRVTQSGRKIGDRELLSYAATKVVSGENFVSRPLLRFGNAVFTVYGFFLRLLVRW